MRLTPEALARVQEFIEHGLDEDDEDDAPLKAALELLLESYLATESMDKNADV